ncbi:MAG: rRNA methyltransferase [Alphaproteobacteria bacterium]|nr:rRNA methyltransferase [Alphaproteobacteria bacterium]|tara:strand:+ start:12323 stop:13006 length:684 start_codon:yes stop_codon:yes gene_type:complete
MSRNKAKTRVRSARGRKNSSTRWLQRQLNDPYVNRAQKEGYRGRAAFKLVEMNEKLNFLRPDMTIVDLGSAPGGWSQVAAQYGAKIVAIDLLEMDELAGVDFVQMDFMDDAAPDKLKDMLGGQKADVVMSDIAPNTMGHKQTDHLRIMAVVEAAYMFACEVLKPEGIFIAKVFQGGAQNTLLSEMKRDFKVTRHIKPPASRKDSSEQYLVATGFRGRDDDELSDEAT